MSFVILSTTGWNKVLLECHFEVEKDHFELISLWINFEVLLGMWTVTQNVFHQNLASFPANLQSGVLLFNHKSILL